MKYYEQFIDELYPAGFPMDVSFIDAPEGGEEFVTEIGDSMLKLYLCARRMTYEAKRGMKEVVVAAVQKSLDRFVSDENAPIDIGGLTTQIVQGENWTSFVTEWRIEAAKTLMYIFWMECKRWLDSNKPTDKPPTFGIGIRRKADNTVWLVYLKPKQLEEK